MASVPPPLPNPVDAYWEPAYRILYEAYMQELISEDLAAFWGLMDTLTTVAVAITAPASTITGWAMWNEPAGKLTWAAISGTASLISVLAGALVVPGRVKQQGELRSAFLHLRLDLEAFRDDLPTLQYDESRQRFQALRIRYQQELQKTKPDIALTIRRRENIQNRLDGIMKKKGYIP